MPSPALALFNFTRGNFRGLTFGTRFPNQEIGEVPLSAAGRRAQWESSLGVPHTSRQPKGGTALPPGPPGLQKKILHGGEFLATLPVSFTAQVPPRGRFKGASCSWQSPGHASLPLRLSSLALFGTSTPSDFWNSDLDFWMYIKRLAPCILIKLSFFIYY